MYTWVFSERLKLESAPPGEREDIFYWKSQGGSLRVANLGG